MELIGAPTLLQHMSLGLGEVDGVIEKGLGELKLAMW